LKGSVFALRRVATLCVLSSAACSLLVDSEPGTIFCRDAGHIGPPACDPGAICASGRCERCADRDACGDEVDNDCNGHIADGCPEDGGSEPSGAAGAAGGPGR
jgi:hypothetical protein